MIEKSKIVSSLKTPLAIIGLGVSGESVLSLLLELGVPRSSIATYDQRAPADFSDESVLLSTFQPKTIVVSPGVPLSLGWIQSFSKHGGLITSELELASQFFTTERVIAVTGSVGKSTVVSILGAGLMSFSHNSFVGGNLGIPLAQYATELCRGRTAAEWVILELSSYQLENFKNLRADWSALVSLAPNHLERYGDLEAYYLTKLSLLKKTTNVMVCNKNGGDLFSWLTDQEKNEKFLHWTSREDPSLTDYELSASQLLGLHNQDNLSVAVSLALLANWPKTSITAMKQFRGLSHRLENLGDRAGVRYVNDSKATTIESVSAAVQSLLPTVTGRIHLLLGGRDKNLPWHELRPLSNNKKLCFYFFGECAALAKSRSLLAGDLFMRMDLAVLAAKESSQPGDLVLLSPGGTSLDEFHSFTERGDAFRKMFLAF